MSDPTQITQGLLDALVLTPAGDWLAVDVTGLPGFRASLKLDAVQELRQALDVILGPTATPDLALLVREMFEIYDRPCQPNGDWRHVEEYQSSEARIRALVGAPKAAPWEPQ